MPTPTAFSQEIDALRALHDAIDPLDPDARRRVLRWALEVFADKTASGRPKTNGHAAPLPTLSAQSVRMKAAWARKRERDGKAPNAAVTTKVDLLAQRQRTADLLDSFDLVAPRPGKPRNPIGILITRGYLKRKGAGFVRTSKVFHVDPSKQAPK